MKQEIIQKILADSGLDAEKQALLQHALLLTEEMLALPKGIPEDRCLAMGHHLAEAIKRTIRDEQLEPIEEETLAQIEWVYREQGQLVLHSLVGLGENICSTAEIALFAIHLQCAGNGF